jgi:hypothetical protein
MKQKIAGFLLENANPSIRYRVLTEILGQTVSESETREMQAEILAEPTIQLISACQKENGWLGNGFHGPNKNAGPYENQEVGTKYLGEKLVFRDEPVLARAMDAFITVPLTDLCYRTHGKYYDEFKYAANGQNIIRCACIARAGYADRIDISPQIQLSLDSFRRLTEVDSILEISRIVKSSGKEKRVFNKNERWPCWYHLDILAHTDSWKSAANVKILADSVNALMRTDRPEKQVGADSWVGHVLGTTGCFKEGFSLRNGDGAILLDRCEWLCRCGIAPYVPALSQVVEEIAGSMDESGVCRASIDENQLHGFSTYGGQQLEIDWKSPVRYECDVTYRALLILHHSGYLG